jgi:iron complex outermembrane receptor protein
MMGKYLVAFAVLFIACLSSIHLSAQTVLETVQVEAYRLSTPEALIPGALYIVDSAAIKSFAASDLSGALNGIPGVKMETRGDGGSRRLHVRGSALRSPYSVRNTMLFYDGFVLTEADGNSPLEWIDPDLVQSLSLVSGPAAASFGGAYGGALNIYTPSFTKPDTHAWVHTQAGTTGSNDKAINTRIASGIDVGFENMGVSISAIMTDNPGYRSWEWNNKTQINLRFKYFDKAGGIHSLITGHYDGAWALPGAIKQAQVDTLPTASPGEDFNAHVTRVRDIAGYKFEKTFSSGWEFSASLLGRFTSKTNPYGTSPFYKGYKEEAGSGYSLLASAGKNLYEGEVWSFDFEMTVMQLNDKIQITEWEAEPSPLTVIIPMRFDLTMNAQQNFVSSSWVATRGNNFRIEGQIGLSNRSRSISGSLYTDNISTPHSSEITHNTILPRVGVSWEFVSGYSLFAQASTGFSDPTAFEIVNPEDGQISDLDSESAFGMEMGVRGQVSDKVKFGFTAYQSNVNSAILQVIQENDAIAFANIDGGLIMNGLELEFSYRISDQMNIRAYGTQTLHRFGEETDHAGSSLPGSPRTSGGVQLKSKYSWGNACLNTRHIGKTPLNNEGSSVMDAYSVIDASVSVNLPYDMSLELGARNILDAEYSAWPQLNGVYGKFYNPAPPRTAYLSLRWSI